MTQFSRKKIISQKSSGDANANLYGRIFAYENTGSSVTGTTVETIVRNISIPANSMTANSVMNIFNEFSKTTTSGLVNVTVYIAPITNSLVGAIPFSIIPTLSTSVKTVVTWNRIVNKNSLSTNKMQDVSSAFPFVTSTSPQLNRNINFANNQWIIVTIALANSADLVLCESTQIYIDK